jgi:rubrerythrin
MARELGLEEALDIAMDAELKAQAFYAQAAIEVQDPNGRDLLGRLAAFEHHHYQKLAELARSLYDTGQFIDYEAQTLEQFLPLAGSGEVVSDEFEGLKDTASILTRAIQNEKIAGERYRALAEETDDPRGKDMFRKLSHEEQIHERVLEDEFYSLSNQGVWGWSGLYGE